LDVLSHIPRAAAKTDEYFPASGITSITENDGKCSIRLPTNEVLVRQCDQPHVLETLPNTTKLEAVLIHVGKDKDGAWDHRIDRQYILGWVVSYMLDAPQCCRTTPLLPDWNGGINIVMGIHDPETGIVKVSDGDDGCWLALDDFAAHAIKIVQKRLEDEAKENGEAEEEARSSVRH